MVEQPAGGRIVVVRLPSGSPGAGSRRLRSVLTSADILATDDPDRLAEATQELAVQPAGRVVQLAGPELAGPELAGPELAGPELAGPELAGPQSVDTLLAQAAGGASVAVVTAGEPDHRLVAAAYQAQLPVTVVPGPSRVTAALAVAGLPSDRFRVEGALPGADPARQERLAALAAESRTVVLFETGQRLAATLAELAQLGPDRPVVICQASHQPVRRGGLVELAGWVTTEPPPAGDLTLVIGGVAAPATAAPDPAALRQAVAAEQAAGRSHRDAVAVVAGVYGLRRREVYQATLP